VADFRGLSAALIREHFCLSRGNGGDAVFSGASGWAAALFVLSMGMSIRKTAGNSRRVETVGSPIMQGDDLYNLRIVRAHDG